MEPEDFVDHLLGQYKKLNSTLEELDEFHNIDRDDIVDGVVVEHDAEGVVNIDIDTTHGLDKKIQQNDNILSSIKQGVDEQINDVRRDILNIFHNDKLISSKIECRHEIIYWYEILQEIDEAKSFWEYIIENKNPKMIIDIFEKHFNPNTRKYGNRVIKQELFKCINENIDKNNWSRKDWIEYLIENTKKLNIEDMWDKTHQIISHKYSITGEVEYKNLCQRIQNVTNEGDIIYSNIKMGLLFNDDEATTISRLERMIEIGDYKNYLLPNDNINNTSPTNPIRNTPISIKYLCGNVCHDNINKSLSVEGVNPLFKSYYDKFVLNNNIQMKNQTTKKPRIF